MASTLTQSPINSSSQNYTEPPIDLTTEPPAKKQKSLEAKSVIDIQRILECPVCYKTPNCPDEVRFCSNGHLLCNDCHKNILDKKCPVCRSEDWNGKNLFVKQILSALPKMCPFQGCDVQLESKDRSNHMKFCQYRLIDCICHWDCQSTKIVFKDSLVNHLIKKHQAQIESNTDGYLNHSLSMEDSDFENHLYISDWTPDVTEFDGQTFIVRCYEKGNLFYIQAFIHENLEIADKYSCKISINNPDDPNCNVTLSGDVISVDVQQDVYMQENHSRTFSFTKSMLRKLAIKNGTALIVGITIFKKSTK